MVQMMAQKEQLFMVFRRQHKDVHVLRNLKMFARNGLQTERELE